MWRSKKDSNKSSKQKNGRLLKSPKSFIERVNSEQGQTHRVLVTHLLSMTLTREFEIELLWFVAQGFDLPLVIGEQFICKTRKFQSASYHACLEFTLTTLFHEDFAQEIWLMLLSKLHEYEICQLALIGLERKNRKYNFKTYENCFIGRECIDWMLSYKFVRTRERGIALGEIWEERCLIQHVTKGHTFKDDQLFYTFGEEQIIKHIKLLKQSRNSSIKSNRYNSSMPNIPNTMNTIGSIDDLDTHSPMMRNKSNQSNSAIFKKVNSNKKNIKNKNKKQKYNQNKNKIKKSKNIIKDKENNNMFSQNNNYNIYNGSANTIIDEDIDSKIIYSKEWSDSEKEQGDIVSDSDRLNSPNNNQQNNMQKQHRNKQSISLT